MSTEELVVRAIEDHRTFKQVASELTKRAPDRAATEALVRAYREGRAPPWLVAHLLGCTGAGPGYAVAREILISAPGSLAESYAGLAMARISPKTAEEDLVDILGGDAHRRTSEGAAYGLGALGAQRIVRHIVAARREKRINASCAGAVIASQPDSGELFREWLKGHDLVCEDIAIEGAVQMSASKLLDAALADAILQSLEAGRVKVSPRIRRLLRKRIAEVLADGI